MHLRECLREREPVIAGERPNKARYRREDIEERDKDDDTDDDDEEVCGGLRAGGLVVDLDDGEGVGSDDGGVADGEEDRRHEGELHDCVEDDGEDHRARDANAGFLDFIGHVHDTICGVDQFLSGTVDYIG